MTIAEVIQSTPTLSTMVTLLQKGNLLRSLDNTHGFLMTFFAPTNEAFRRGSIALGVDIVRCLSTKRNELRDFLEYHKICNALYSSILVNLKSVFTEASNSWRRGCNKLSITVNDDGIQVGKTGSFITQVDIAASNGVIHQLSLPLINPCLNLTKLCSNFPYTPTTSTPVPMMPSPSPSPSPASSPPPPPLLPASSQSPNPSPRDEGLS